MLWLDLSLQAQPVNPLARAHLQWVVLAVELAALVVAEIPALVRSLPAVEEAGLDLLSQVQVLPWQAVLPLPALLRRTHLPVVLVCQAVGTVVEILVER